MILSYVSMAWLPLLMCLTTLDVALRYFLNRPLYGVMEYSEFMLVPIVWFSLAYVSSVGGHVTMDTLVSRLSERRRAWVQFLCHLIILALLTIVVKTTFDIASYSWQMREPGEITKFPAYIVKGCMFIGASWLWLQTLMETLVRVTRLRGGQQATKEVQSSLP